MLDLGKHLMRRGSDQKRVRPGDRPSCEMVEAGLLPPVKGLYWDNDPGVSALPAAEAVAEEVA